MQVFISITLKAFFDGRRDLLKGLESREGVDPSLRDGSPVAEAGANGKGQALSDRSYPSTPTTIKTRMETKIAGQPHRHPSSSSRSSSRGVSPLSLSTAPIQMPHPLGETGREICVYEYVYEYGGRIGENRSLSYSYTYSYTPISSCQGSSTAVSRINASNFIANIAVNCKATNSIATFTGG
jgi:hypothetical protein